MYITVFMKSRGFSAVLKLTLTILVLYLGFLHYSYNRDFGIDDSYITYRYSFNFADGDGLVFNVGEKHYGSTAAGYAVLLGVISKSITIVNRFFGSANNSNLDLREVIPALSRVISTLSLILSASLLIMISWNSTGMAVGSIIGAFIAANLFLAGPANSVVGHETYFFLALWLLAAYLVFFSGKYFAGSVILALATTIRPDTILFTGVLFFIMATTNIKIKGYILAIKDMWRPAILYIILNGIWFSIMWFYYGQPLPETRIAKQAQVILGHWKIFSPSIIYDLLTNSLTSSMGYMIVIGGFLFISYLVLLIFFFKSSDPSRKTTAINTSDINLFVFTCAWVIVGIGLVAAYTFMKVTYWQWYGVPVWFAVICLIPGLCRSINLAIISSVRFQKWAGILSASTLVGVFAMNDLSAFLWHYKNMKSVRHINTHIGSYDGAVSILQQVAPAGASIAMAEPGYVGFILGPKYKLIDTLGLASPGVSRAIIKGDMDYPFKTWSPDFVISSWKGKYDPTSRPWFHEVYTLHSEVTHPHWSKALGGSYQIYEKR